MKYEKLIDRLTQAHKHLIILTEWQDPTPEQVLILEWLRRADHPRRRDCRIYDNQLYWPVTRDRRVFRLNWSDPELARSLRKRHQLRFQTK